MQKKKKKSVSVKKIGLPVAILPSIGCCLFHSFQSFPMAFKECMMDTRSSEKAPEKTAIGEGTKRERRNSTSFSDRTIPFLTLL